MQVSLSLKLCLALMSLVSLGHIVDEVSISMYNKGGRQNKDFPNVVGPTESFQHF